MSRVHDYAFINAKLRARLEEMRAGSVVEKIIKAPTLFEAISSLEDTRYKYIREVYSLTGDLQAVEFSILEEEVRQNRLASDHVSKKTKVLIGTLLEKSEIENLKNAIRLWFADNVKNRGMKYRSAYILKEKLVHDIDYIGIINARSFSEIVDSLKNSPYFETLKDFKEEDIAEQGLFKIEITLDHIYFSHLFLAIKKLSKYDRKSAEEIYKTDIDLKNLLMIMRYSYFHHLDKDTLKAVVIPEGRIYKDLILTDALLQEEPMPFIRKTVEKLYPSLRDEIKVTLSDDEGRDTAEKILMLEEDLNRVRLNEYNKILRENPFTVGTVLAYFFLLKQQDNAIAAALSAKYYRWDEKRIREAINL